MKTSLTCALRMIAVLEVLAAWIVPWESLQTSIPRFDQGLAATSATNGDRRTVRGLLLEVDRPIREWLGDQADGLVLRPDIAAPCVVVINDQSERAPIDFSICVVAWDECGLVPAESVCRDSLLCRGIPPEVLLEVRARGSRAERVGLNCFGDGSRVAAFPRIPTSQERKTLNDPRYQWRPSQTIGAWIATHNPGKLNLSTARFPLVEQALRIAECGGLDEIRKARQAGQKVVAPTRDASRRCIERTGLELVTVSDCWGFRVDVRVNSTRCSWWLVYQRSDARWDCVQRLVNNDA